MREENPREDLVPWPALLDIDLIFSTRHIGLFNPTLTLVKAHFLTGAFGPMSGRVQATGHWLICVLGDDKEKGLTVRS
jgi:hypothetical protein